MAVLSATQINNWRAWGRVADFRNVAFINGVFAGQQDGKLMLAQTSSMGSRLPVGAIRELALEENQHELPFQFDERKIRFNPDIRHAIRRKEPVAIAVNGMISGYRDPLSNDWVATVIPNTLDYPSVLAMPADGSFVRNVVQEDTEEEGIRVRNGVPGRQNPNANRVLIAGVVRATLRGKKKTPNGEVPVFSILLRQTADDSVAIPVRVLGNYTSAMANCIHKGEIILIEGEYRVRRQERDGQEWLLPYIRTTPERVKLLTGGEGRPDESHLPAWVHELRATCTSFTERVSREPGTLPPPLATNPLKQGNTDLSFLPASY